LIEHGFTSAPTQDGYTADGFYRSDDPTNSVKALKPLMSQTTSTTTIHIQLQTVTLHDLN